MKLKITLLLLLMFAMILTACTTAKEKNKSSNTSSNSYQTITAKQAKKLIDNGNDVVVVDVRTKAEYDAGHIPNAILIPNETIENTMPTELPNKDAEILVYCRSGNRSAQTARKLAQIGYTHVYDFGGMNSWPYDTTKEQGRSTVVEDTTVHSADATPGVLSSFTTTTIDGKKVDQTILKGHKLTMVNIWASYCGLCLREMPELGQLNKELSSQGFQIVGIPVDVIDNQGNFSQSAIADVKEIIAKTQADYMHILPSQSLMEAKLKEIYSVPETIFVDEYGNQVGQSYIGSRSKKDWEKIITSLLKEVEK